MATELVLNDVSKSFDSPHGKGDRISAVENVSFSCHDGEFVSIVGRSGCGKSTILRMIAGLVNPTAGLVSVDSQVVKGPSKERGMVFQEYSLFPYLTVAQNIGFSFKMSGRARENKAKVDEYVRKIGLEKFANSYPSALSGGMRQRVALARTLICNPKILLLDEPLSALDAITRMSMQDEILDMWSGSGSLAIMVTHDVDEAVYMSTKVILMRPNPGRVKRIIPIDIPYRRRRDSDAFVAYRNEILNGLSGNGS